ncbi:MAG: serine hydrolase [Clostridiales bacterium]|nr:serine hydrolase [Clostridiales bacterium]
MTGKSILGKRLLCTVLALFTLLAAAIPAFAEPTAMSEYAVLIDSTTGQVLYSKGMDESISPSGLVKLMTALVAVESGTPLSTKLTVTSDALAPLGTGYRSMDLVAGEQITLEDCLCGMILNSANDASNVIAEKLGGDIDTFVKKMNSKTEELGLKNTSFVNPSGLPENGQKSTVYDMAMILRNALSNSDFSKIFGMQECTILPTNYNNNTRNYKTRCLMNHNASEYAFDGTLGGTIGYSTDDGYIIATAAVRDNRTLIAVVAEADSEANLYADAAALLEYGFDGFTEVSIAGSDFASGSIPLTENGVKVGSVVFSVANETVNVLLSADRSSDNVEAVAEALPSSIEKNSPMEYTANICYRLSDGTYEVLLRDVLLTADIRLDATGTATADPAATGSIATDDDGNPITDEAGNVVTNYTGESTGGSSGSGGGFKKFILTLLKVLLIIIACVAGLILIFLLTLVIIKQVKRNRKRKARARAAAERAARAQRQRNDRNYY